MTEIIYIDRLDGQFKKEKVYKGKILNLLYGHGPLSKILRFCFLPFIARLPFVSAFYGYLQKKSWSRKKISPFIKKYGVDENEFLESVSRYHSFNDFFIRHLKKEARPIAPGAGVAVIPADGRYYFYENIATCDGFIVKGKKFQLKDLLGDENLAQEYSEAAMVMARLCPSDYHRFHFPCDCTPHEAKLIPGSLYSVNPIAVRKNLEIFTENKRMITRLESAVFGSVLYLEIGATNVGSIQETYTPFFKYLKGAEKGYFGFGGSALILLFRKGSIQFDADLLSATQQGYEIRCLLGQSLGRNLPEP